MQLSADGLDLKRPFFVWLFSTGGANARRCRAFGSGIRCYCTDRDLGRSLCSWWRCAGRFERHATEVFKARENCQTSGSSCGFRFANFEIWTVHGGKYELSVGLPAGRTHIGALKQSCRTIPCSRLFVRRQRRAKAVSDLKNDNRMGQHAKGSFSSAGAKLPEYA